MQKLQKIKVYLKKYKLYKSFSRYYKKTFTMSKITLSEIRTLLTEKFNIQNGDTIIVHTSYRHISKTDYEPEEIIEALKQIVGPTGNIIMPSFRRSKEFYKQIPFNPAQSRGKSGLINEIFRRTPESVQSLHPWKSCIVWGKDAEELVKDHYKSERAFDENSPYYKAMVMKGKYIGIGVSTIVCSFFHTAEDSTTGLFDELYDPPLIQEIIVNNQIIHKLPYRHIKREAMKKSSPNNVIRHLKEPDFCNTNIRNIPFSYADLHYLYTSIVNLAKQGITLYSDENE